MVLSQQYPCKITLFWLHTGVVRCRATTLTGCLLCLARHNGCERALYALHRWPRAPHAIHDSVQYASHVQLAQCTGVCHHGLVHVSVKPGTTPEVGLLDRVVAHARQSRFLRVVSSGPRSRLRVLQSGWTSKSHHFTCAFYLGVPPSTLTHCAPAVCDTTRTQVQTHRKHSSAVVPADYRVTSGEGRPSLGVALPLRHLSNSRGDAVHAFPAPCYSLPL